MTRKGGSDPLNDLLAVQTRMNQLFERALARTEFDAQDELDSWSPTADVFETGEALVIAMELAGVEQERIELRIDHDELVVEGEREIDRERGGDRFHRVESSYGRFSRSFRLPSDADRERVQANYRNGLLTVTVPKTGRSKPRPVRVAID